MYMNKTILASTLFLALLVSAAPAATLDLYTGDNVDIILDNSLVVPRVGGIEVTLGGTSYGGPAADVNVGADAVWAGMYRIDIFDGVTPVADAYATFCTDITKDPPLTLETYLLTHNVPTIAQFDDLRFMWGTYYAGLNTAVKAAAFQLAVWEVIHEGGAYDLGSGNFFLSGLDLGSPNNNGATQAGLIAQANAYLTNLTTQADLLMAVHDVYQPFLIEVTEGVPEPGTLGLLIFGSLVFLRRKA